MILFKRQIRKIFLPKIRNSYAQFGEDLILSQYFFQSGIKKPTYLDIGANEPEYISNTYLFYEQGSRGVLIEPNPFLYRKLKKVRPKDICLNVGIGLNEVKEAPFYVFPNHANGLSTFSEADARHWETIGMKGVGKISVEKLLQMPLVKINTILETYFKDAAPNFISIDVEGLDLQILQSMDFEKYRPEFFCIETLLYDENQNGFKNQAIIKFLLEKDYVIYADTRVNTIFCRKEMIA